MLAAARHVATEAGCRLTTLSRTMRFFAIPELMRLYNAQILSYLESSTPALYHAAAPTLVRIDRLHLCFLREIGLSELDALRNYRVARLMHRRDVTMLGAPLT